MRALLALALLAVAPAPGQTQLPATRPLELRGDPAAEMVEAIHAYLDRETARARDLRGTGIPDRDHLRRIIGAVDPRVARPAPQVESAAGAPAEIAAGPAYRVYAVRWPVFDDVDAEGLLLEPAGRPKAGVVAIPDADVTPESLARQAHRQEPPAQVARRFAESGCEVLVPVLIDRQDTWSGIPGVRMTNQPHREWIYRMAFEAGRHIIGYEVEKVLAAVDWFAGRGSRIAVAGRGEGGLIALHAAALDPRIGAALVSGYFQPRDAVWKEPIYRDIWGLLRHFGDAEIARLIAAGRLIVEAAGYPEIAGPPAETRDRRGAAPVGALTAPSPGEVRREADRAGPGRVRVVESDGDGALLSLLEIAPVPNGAPLQDRRRDFDPAVRAHRQFDQLVAHTQAVIRRSPQERAAFWSPADASSPERWRETTVPMRQHIWNEVIGRMPDPSVPADPRSRLIIDAPRFRGYEVALDVWPGIFAYGILLVPKDLRDGERRPVVVCQHGLEGRPRDVADPAVDSPAYHRFAARLADQGFITFSPQNPYIGLDRFRQIQRKAHPLGLSLFSFILGQHQRILEWLAGLPFVDPQRIGFYGLSYGGKTAVRVPPLLDGYALSICSGDFNEWVWKTTSIDSRYSYMITQEYDMLEWNFANTVNYSGLANLMAPRPFMVERGHDDGVAPDEWVAYEYATVRRFYSKLAIPDRTEIEFFDGPHTIHGVGTFAFLRKHLRFPE
jgi:dienelactone hydrolase